MNHRKNTEAGIAERKALLKEENEELETVYDDAVKTFIKQPSYARRLSKNSKDDVLDALVLAHTACRGELTTLPDEPEEDMTKEEPLPIEIVYPVV